MGNTIKKLILVILFLISITSLAESQTRLKFGDVFLKDTLSGAMKITSGSLYLNNTDSIRIGGMIINQASIRDVTGGIHFVDGGANIDDDGQDIAYVSGTGGNHLFNDNVTIDSILTLRHATTITLESDDSVVTITSSCMILTSDDATSTNRTFTLTDGTTAGQLLIIEWIGAVGSKEGEILDAGSESGLNGTMTFDALDDTIMLKWTGTYWRELSRVEH